MLYIYIILFIRDMILHDVSVVVLSDFGRHWTFHGMQVFLEYDLLFHIIYKISYFR